MVLLSDGKTLMIATRIDGGDGGPPYCPVTHTPKNYHSVFSSDGGRTWTPPRVMRDSTGRGMGTAFPRLLMLGDKDSGSPQRLLLSGGRLFTEGLIDIYLWVSSDGMGTRWVRVTTFESCAFVSPRNLTENRCGTCRTRFTP